MSLVKDAEPPVRLRRMKREKSTRFQQDSILAAETSVPAKPKRKSKALQKHGSDAPSGGIESLVPSLIGLAILVCGVMAKMGFRGRASVAGIDLGTTNSVICVQKPDKGVGVIECIPDPSTNSPIIPSVVSFLEPWERKVGPSSKLPSQLLPHPSHVVVGQAAKRRIDSHPHHTLYQAKRVVGRPATDPAIAELRAEVEFGVHAHDDHEEGVFFKVPDTPLPITPQQVGSYVVHHLVQITKQFLGHNNVMSAVICVPAKFDDHQRQKTYDAFRAAGISVARIVEEPTAAALAYGLHRKEGVDYILVYDFGGGTLDISMLHVSDGFVDVMGSDGDSRVGGADFDTAVAHFLLAEHKGQAIVDRVSAHLHRLEESLPGVDLEDRLAAKCVVLADIPLCTASSFHTIGEQLKIELSAYPDGGGKVSAQCQALEQDLTNEQLSVESFCAALRPTTLQLTSQEFNRSVKPLLDRSALPVERLLKDLQLKTGDIDEVVMVGGTTRMPQIRNLVRKVLPDSEMNTHIDPDITVAYGAASVID
jgi:molecular chaperone DnaK (HSP70)